MKKTIFLAAIAAAMMVGMPAQVSAQKNGQEVEVNDPCPLEQYPSTAEVIRGHGVGVDRNQQFSVTKARTYAINDLAAQLSTTIDAVMKMSDESWDMGANSEYAGHALQEIQAVIKQSTGFNIVCRKTVSVMQNGMNMMKTYMVVELKTDQVLKQSYDVLHDDPNISFEQSYEDFKKTFEEQF